MTMRPCDRFVSFFYGQPVDRPPLLETKPWETTLARWRAEGLDDAQGLPYLEECDSEERTAADLWMLPRYEVRVLAEDEESVTRINDVGVTERYLKPEGSAMPQHIRFPVEGRDDWLALKPRLQPGSGPRLPADWDARRQRWQRLGTTVIFQGPRSPGFFGFIRELMGPERALTLFYDDPWLVEDMMETSLELTLAVLAQALDSYPLAGLYFWEDMAYKAGSLISPAMFRRFMLPRYRRVVDYARARGVPIILVDSDGNIEQLIPLWLEAGLDGVYPLEVAAAWMSSACAGATARAS